MSDEEKTITQDDNLEELDSATPSEEVEENQSLSEETNNEIAKETNNQEEIQENSEEIKEEKVETENLSKDDEVSTDLLDYLSDDILNVPEFDASKSGGDASKQAPEFLQAVDLIPDIKEREVIKGNIAGFTDREVLVDIGFKSEGVVARSEFLNEIPEIGQEIDVYLVRLEDRKGNIILSKEKADFEKRWSSIKTAFENEEIINLIVSLKLK